MIEFRVLVAAVMAVGSLVCLALVVHHVARIGFELNRIHMQQANIIGMLLKAGFRPANTLDWLEDGDKTRVAGALTYTLHDWKVPDDGNVSG